MRYEVTIAFSCSSRVPKREIKNFIKEWLETGGGCRHPDDLLFESLGKVSVGPIKPTSQTAPETRRS